MKLLLFACLLLRVVESAPQSIHAKFADAALRAVGPTIDFVEDIDIVSDNRVEHTGDGRFAYDFETRDGVRVEAVGTPGSKGQSNIRGSYSFTFPDGTRTEVYYVADENGFRLLPSPSS